MPRPSALAAAVALAALLPVYACDTDGTEVPIPLVVPCSSTAALVSATDLFPQGGVELHMETGGDPGLEIVRGDVGAYASKLWATQITATADAPDFTNPTPRAAVWISNSSAAQALAGVSPTAGYVIQRVAGPVGPVVVVTADNTQDLAYGAYALLEELGVRFFHPMQELVPVLDGPRLPHTLNIARAPALPLARPPAPHAPPHRVRGHLQPAERAEPHRGQALRRLAGEDGAELLPVGAALHRRLRELEAARAGHRRLRAHRAASPSARWSRCGAARRCRTTTSS